MSDPLHVIKLGGSVLTGAEDLPRAVSALYQAWRSGERVLAVVSAWGGETERLLKRAHALDDEPDAEALAALLATGKLGGQCAPDRRIPQERRHLCST